jgi:hypothetical protein
MVGGSISTSRRWRESQFEKWFLKHPVLPDGERLRFIGKHRPLRRVVDLLALDGEGGLVIVEVKNERSNRTAVGQALEYLSQYQQASLEELDEQMGEEFGESLSEAFKAEFKRDLGTLSPRRRVILVAPSFDVATGVCVQYLSEHFEKKVTFALLTAQRRSRGFRIAYYEPPNMTHCSQLGGRFAETVKGRVYFVLTGGPKPILWNIGMRRDGGLRLPSQQALSLRVLRRMSRHLVPIEDAPWVNLEQQGTVWRNPKTEMRAKLLGVVTPDAGGRKAISWAVYARFERGKFARYRKQQWLTFERDWHRVDESLPDWTACFL